MKTRNRSYDWLAVIAEGDVQYEDGFDSWDDMVMAISGADNVPIIKSHDHQGHLGKISDFQLDHVNKLVKARFDGNINYDDSISVQWGVDDEGHIKTLNHVAIGEFKPMCPKNKCNLERNRSENMSETDDKKEIENISIKKEAYEELISTNQELLIRLAAMEKKFIEPKEEPVKEEKLELKEKESIKQEIKTQPKSAVYDPFDIGSNTRIINNLRGK